MFSSPRCESRGDLVAHVFDVSDSYAGHWAKWIPEERRAAYELPANWQNTFDLVTAHFVLEHVADPVAVLTNLRTALKPGGKAFLSVPNAVTNSGDFLVADHINHFSRTSFEAAIERARFRVITIDEDAYRGAFVAVAENLEAGSDERSERRVEASADEIRAFTDLGAFWTKATERLSEEVAKRGRHRCAIYGAGFYGSFIAMRIGGSADVECFVDRNPHVRLQPLMGRPVVAPEEVPKDVEIVYAGLNPASARKILDDVPEWRGRKIEVIYLE